MKDGNSDEKLVSFLKQYRPNSPEAAPDFEHKVLAAIDRNEAAARKLNYLGEPQFIGSHKKSGIVGFGKWMLPSAIAAGLLVFWSGYRVLVTAQKADEAAHLEAFLVNNWEGVLNDSHHGENSPDFAVNTDTEPPTNN
jgi:hypothetical protein